MKRCSISSMLRFWVALLLASCFFPTPAQDLTPAEWLWTIKTDSTLRLREIPNYTCLETVQTRSQPAQPGARENLQESQVQVAMIGGRELFSAPGGNRFELTAPPSLPLPRFTTIGLYFSLARGLMGESAANEQPLERTGDLRPYRFQIPASSSPWVIEFNGKSATAGEKGTFLAGATDHLLHRIALDTLDIQPDIGLASLHINVEYTPMEISSKKVLLPTTADVIALEKNRSTHRSHIQFTNCHAFVAESNVSF